MVQRSQDRNVGRVPFLRRPGVREKLEEHVERHGLTREGRDFVLRAFESPARRVGDRRVRKDPNVIVRYISWKMGLVIQCESRTVEHAFVELCEFDPQVVFYVCQPDDLYVRRRNIRGREAGNWTTPDYLVVSDEKTYLVECKTRGFLRRDAASANPKFIWEKASGWRWPAAEAAAAELGLGFRVFSSEEVNPTWHRNMRFLADFFETDCTDPEMSEFARKEVAGSGSMRIEEVLGLPGMKAEVLWWLVAQRQLWADVEFELLFEGDMSSVHSSRSRMIVSRERFSRVSEEALLSRVNTVQLEPGSRLCWEDRRYVVLKRGAEDVLLREDAEGTRSFPVSVEDVKGFLAAGVMTGVESEDDSEIRRAREAVLWGASDEERERALWKFGVVTEYLETGKRPADVGLRSLRRYVARFREGERLLGSGLCGLFVRMGRRPGKSDLGERQREKLKKFVDEFVKDKSAGRLVNAYARLVAECEEEGISPVPCKETLRLAFKKRRKDEVIRGREGERAAGAVSGPLVTDDPVIPRKADRIWQVAHIDHLLVKVQLVSGRTGAALGMAWLTLMIDDFSRMPLAMWLSFDDPSRVAVLKALFDCVKRHNRVPDYLVVDQGPEFSSKDAEGAFAYLKINKVERPGGKPRFGAVIERMFGTTNTRLIHELPGNVKRKRQSRTQSRSHDPKRLATLTLRRLHEILEEWFFDEYPGLCHGSLGAKTPRDVYRKNLAYSGERGVRYVANDSSLRMNLMVTPAKPTRKVWEGGVIWVDGLRYHDKALLAGDVVGSTVRVKLDSEDGGVVYVWLRRKWITCRLTDGNAELSGRSWKELKLVVEELRQQNRIGATAGRKNAGTIGRYLKNLDVGGGAARQAERDREARSISRNGSVEDESSSQGAGTSEVPLDKSEGGLADNVFEGVDLDDVLAGAEPLKVVRR